MSDTLPTAGLAGGPPGRVTVGKPVPDVLGDGYEAIPLHLPPEDGQPLRATVVRRRAPEPTGRAILYVHGFADYFFQTELADFHVARGTDFYAVDLRRYGRSLLPGQTPYQTGDLAEYTVELDAALALITADGHDRVTVEAHSTGGLITPLWLADRADPGPVDALVLNSPFLAINASAFVRTVVGPGVSLASRWRPGGVLPLPDHGLYGRSISAQHDGEWTFDLQWKPVQGVPVHLGWLAAIRRGQHRLRHNLGLPFPVLVLCSTRTVRTNVWTEDLLRGDAVLDADRIADLSPRLGRHVTCVRVPDALHDVLLSRPEARRRAYDEMAQWLTRYGVG
ncbi:alpha/beta hydrolase [Nakamurella endophytica]|uniref:Alpha/beta hydrolase n=1 Tax=Nakamurella endophytica TaxID=1748367 RepID=A0A917SPZ9_9ACTN|nr:alpha/beta hydrolase [Nakamurella endophytica]GGL89390.1 alpha/beta hydrolase [Nakamurella endophytica]